MSEEKNTRTPEELEDDVVQVPDEEEKENPSEGSMTEDVDSALADDDNDGEKDERTSPTKEKKKNDDDDEDSDGEKKDEEESDDSKKDDDDELNKKDSLKDTEPDSKPEDIAEDAENEAKGNEKTGDATGDDDMSLQDPDKKGEELGETGTDKPDADRPEGDKSGRGEVPAEESPTATNPNPTTNPTPSPAPSPAPEAAEVAGETAAAEAEGGAMAAEAGGAAAAEGGGAAVAEGAGAAAGAGGISVLGIVIIVILVILILIGVFGFLTAVPSMTVEKAKEFVQGIWDGIQGYFIGADRARVNDEELVEVAQYLYDMGYDLEGCGFVDKVEFEEDSNGNSTGVITKVKSSYLTAYLVAENRTYMISNDNFNWTDVFESLVNGRLSDGITSAWGTGLIHIEKGLWSEVAWGIMNGIPILDLTVGNIADLVESVSVDRETNTLKISRADLSSGLAFWNWHRDTTYYNLAGWSGRYGKPFELLLTLHLATMAPDFTYEIAMNEDLNARVNICLKDAKFEGNVYIKTSDGLTYDIDDLEDAGYSDDVIKKIKELEKEAQNINTKTPYIKDVQYHWFRNVYFDTDGKSVEYAVVDEEEEEDETTSEEKKDIQYVYEEVDGERKLKTTKGKIDVYEVSSSSTEEFEYTGEVEGLNSGDKVIFKGTIADKITQKEDGVRGVTNKTTKKLFKGKYYIYDGTIETANKIKNGEAEKQQLDFNKESLSAFSILENETSIDSQLIYRDLKELLVELDYYDYEDFEKDVEEILEWPIPEYEYYMWPYTYLEKQVLDYGTLMLSEATVDQIKQETGLTQITMSTPISKLEVSETVAQITGRTVLSAASGNADQTVASNMSTDIKNTVASKVKGNVKSKFLSEETQTIVENHIYDFDVDNFTSKMNSYGGYESYLKNELGGVFAKYAGVDNIANVTTEEELQEVSEYVFGLMCIYGFDYSNGKPENYGIWRANDGGTSDGFYKGRTSGKTDKVPVRNIDSVCSGQGMNMTVCCNWGVDYVYYKAGIFSRTDETKPSSSSNYKDLINNHNGEIISQVSDLKVGDLIHCFRTPVTDYSNPSSWSDWYHVCYVGEIDEEAGTLTMYDSGHFFTNSGNFKNVVKLDGSNWPYQGWAGVRIADFAKDDQLVGFGEGLDVIAMGDGTVLEKVNSVQYGTGVKIELTGDTDIKGYLLLILGFDVSIEAGAEVEATDVIGTTTEQNMCFILIDREKANVENIEDYVKIPKKKNTMQLEGDTVEEKVWIALKKAGYSDEAVAGVMGNIYGESGFNPAAVEGGSGIGFGLCQWSYGRRTQLESFARSRGVDPSDADLQIEFLLAELQPGGGADGYASYQFAGYERERQIWMTSSSIDETTTAFCKGFERPGVPRNQVRIDAAKRYYEKYAGSY